MSVRRPSESQSYRERSIILSMSHFFRPTSCLSEHFGRTQMTTHDTAEQLASYRKTIDNLDSALLHILAERFRCTEQVGQLKAAQAMPATDDERERRQM